ncbi:MAG: cell division protein ZapA [Prevotellaceae bacterium]|jgi:hypothetical protein|nr:cell division protein ZapA [Prevotellaceae bacterium]
METKSHTQQINVIIAGRKYRYNVATEEEEERYRDAVKMIDVEVKRNSVPDKDYQDILAVSILNFAIQVVKNRKLVSEVEKLNGELGVYLEKQSSLENIE